MRKFFSRIVCVFLAAIVALSVVACGNSATKGKTVLRFWTSVSTDIAKQFRLALNNYNNENEDNIYIQYTNYVTGYETLIQNTLGAADPNSPDIILTTESTFRKWASYGGKSTGIGFFEDLTPYLESNPDSKINDIVPAAISRYHYDYKTMTSNADDPLLAIPYDLDSTTTLYNATAIKEQGIKIISVDEEDLDAFNNGEPDRYGKTKTDYGIPANVKVRARGFDRRKLVNGTYVNNNYVKGTYVNGEFVENTTPYALPEYDSNGKVKELIIFNNRISMSWDEIEDFGRIMTGRNDGSIEKGNTNPNYYKGYPTEAVPSTDWGYFTEWWFSYGWGVGGDCIEDTTGNGDWEFSLLDTTKKRAVYTMSGSEPNQNVDEQAVDSFSGKPLFVEDNGSSDASSYGLAANQYVSDVLPTQRSAFERFFYLQKPKEYGGLYLGPRQMTDIGSSTDTAFFQTGKIALFSTTKSKMIAVRSMNPNFEWDICPPISYRVYDETGDNLIAQTTPTLMNHTKALAVYKNSSYKEEAFKFIEYYATGKFQADVADAKIQCSAVPEQMDEYFVKPTEESGVSPRNISIFTECAKTEFLIDIYYFPDEAWLWEWANPLNSLFRENDKSVDDFYNYKGTSGNSLALYLRVNDLIKNYKELFAK